MVPAGEFLEWEKLAAGKKKYYAKDRAGNLLLVAGLYRDNLDEREFVIITKEATGDMAKIHDRIPVILRVDQIESWLTGDLSPETLKKMNVDVAITPCDEEDLEIQISLF